MAIAEIDVNSKKYSFTKANTIYALPIECVSLEKGGQSPFGEWSQASDNYWAYILVQYNREKYVHTYGFTFKDSVGYGMCPTEYNAINQNSSNQIKTGLNLTKPENGLASSIASKEYWTGFEIDDNTNLVVLEYDDSKKCETKKIVQNASAGTITFSDSVYWVSSGSLKPDYGTTFPTYVYESNSKIYQYVEVYETY